MKEPVSIVSTAVRCRKTNKLQAKRNRAGLFLFCDECRREHFHSWQELGVRPIIEESEEKEH